MIEFGKEYYKSPYYFYLKDKGDKFSVYFSVSDTIAESRKNDEEIEFLTEDFKKIKDFISKLFKSGIKLTKDQVKKLMNHFKSDKKDEVGGEMNEFVGADGSFLGSNIPMLNQRQVAKNTMDQTIKMTRSNQFPFIRVYYGESEEEQDNLIDEINMKKALAFKETKNAKNYKEASKIVKGMGIKDPFERHDRLEAMGFDPEYDEQLEDQKKAGFCKNCFVKRRLAELEKGKMQKMLDEILLNKKFKSSDVVKKNEKSEEDEDTIISKILVRNIEAIKRLADKEGVSIDKLIKHLKTGE
jgi:hypothetical protein